MAALRIAVVIPVARQHSRLARCLQACANLTYEPRIICVVSDEPIDLPDDPHFINVVSGSHALTGPATKRDLARAQCADVDAYAYLDDDAYPPPQWLDEAARVLAETPQAAGVGGPGLEPDDQLFWERVSARALEAHAGSGPLRFRFVREAPRDCDDYPAFDLIVRKEWLDRAGGWATNWYGGEDSHLCARLARVGGLIRYDPRPYVFHYRRALWPNHAWQIWNIGRSRGCLVRVGDPLSRRLVFAAPAALIAAALASLGAGVFLGTGGLAVAAAAALIYMTAAIAPQMEVRRWR
ncbi:MAG: glycosyltransferase, partial [Candidatus Eremiobacteraeota bacterium]|nr:glycosyltransferase [Candidatus Eremiobacteraeota bacterium]